MTSGTKSKPFKWKWGETKSLIITALEKNGPMAPIQIADYLGLDRKLVNKHIRTLRNGDLIHRRERVLYLEGHGGASLQLYGAGPASSYVPSDDPFPVYRKAPGPRPPPKTKRPRKPSVDEPAVIDAMSVVDHLKHKDPLFAAFLKMNRSE